jgi:alpha-mannosidase
MDVPTGLEGKEGQYKRGEKREQLIIRSTFTLRKGQRWIHVRTEVDNHVEQHRLRVCFPTGIDASVSCAEAAFDVIERPIERGDDSLYFNKPNPQYPMHRFVDISDGKIGLAILNDGIREYEAADDQSRTLCITLLRCFTAMQSPVIDQMEIYPWMKLSQSPGFHTWQYAIMPHSGDWHQGKVMLEADRFTNPLDAAQAGKGGGTLPKSLSFLKLDPDTIALSALKKCEHRNTMILRFFNPTSDSVNMVLSSHFPIEGAWMTNMNEERREKLNAEGCQLRLEVGHKKIITLELGIKRP